MCEYVTWQTQKASVPPSIWQLACLPQFTSMHGSLHGDCGGAPTMGAWHLQVKPPLVLTQSELAPHTPGVRAHSSTSTHSAPW